MSAEAIVPDVVPLRPSIGSDGKPRHRWSAQAWQARAYMAIERFLTIPAGRRIGKSEFGVMWSLERYRRARVAGLRGVIWIVYPNYGIARVAWRKFKRLAPRGWVLKYVGTDQHPQAVILRGGISIEFKSGMNPGALVGEGLIAVWIDECGEVKERVWSESLRPTLIDHVAPALFTGTPKGRNWFWKLYQRGWNPDYPSYASIGETAAQGLSTHLNTKPLGFIEASEIEELARDMSERLHAQEILARFLSNEGAVFKVEGMRAKGLAYSMERTIAIGLDIARRRDWTVLVGMDRDFRVTYFARFRDIDWPLQRAKVKAAWEQLGMPAIVCDATGVGDEFVQELQYMGLPVVPFVFTQPTKRQLVELIAISLDKQVGQLPDEPVFLNELEAFDMKQLPSGNIRYEAPEGQHDDCVMAYGLALWGASRYGDVGITFSGDVGRLQPAAIVSATGQMTEQQRALEDQWAGLRGRH